MSKYALPTTSLLSFVFLFFALGALAEEEPGQPIGKVKWEIRDGSNAVALTTGEKTLFTKDVQIKNNSIKMFDIDKTYYFRYEETMSSDKVGNGFGFRCGRSDQETFSWEWFNIDRIGHAKKLQEKGELLFDTQKTSNGTEIRRMEFPTDISFRIIRKGEWNPLNTTWRINILKGSVINWPCSKNSKQKTCK